MKGRYWCFTVNDSESRYAQEDFDPICRRGWFRYMVFQKEQAETGTIHWQGYLQCKNDTRMTTVKRALPGQAHLERQSPNSTPEQARDYCMKEETRLQGPWQHGQFLPDTRSGRRTDLAEVAELLKRSGMREVARQMPTMIIKYARGLSELERLNGLSTALRTVHVTLLYGPTGTGKSMFAYLKAPDAYRKDTEGRFFDSYNGQTSLILDDFAGRMSHVRLVMLLKLLDIYPLMVEVKGSSRQLKVRQIFITTNIHPRMWFDYTRRERQYKALARRIHKVYWVPRDQAYIPVTHESFFDDWCEFCDEESTFEVLEEEDDRREDGTTTDTE